MDTAVRRQLAEERAEKNSLLVGLGATIKALTAERDAALAEVQILRKKAECFDLLCKAEGISTDEAMAFASARRSKCQN